LLLWVAFGATGGILAPALLCGWFYILLRQAREPAYKPNLSDLGQGFEVFGHALLAGIVLYAGAAVVVGAVGVVNFVLSFIPILGWIFGSMIGLLTGILIGPFLLFVFPLIVDRRTEFWPAIEVSFKLAASDYAGFVGFSALLGLLKLAGGLCCGLGLLITVPVVAAAVAIAYEELFAPGAPGAVLVDASSKKVPPPATTNPDAMVPPPSATPGAGQTPPPQ